MEAGGCGFTARIRADYGEHVYMFTMSAETSSGETKLTVLEPEPIAGITASVSSEETSLSFDDVDLDFGRLANGRISPVAAPWLLTQCWEQAYMAYAGSDGEQQRVTYLRGYNEEEVTVDTWFSAGVPVYAEMSCEDIRYLTVEITDFQLKS